MKKSKLKSKSKSKKLDSRAWVVLLGSIGLMTLLLWAVTAPSKTGEGLSRPPIEPGLIDTKVTEAQPPENPDSIHVGAWCDHQSFLKESGLRRHVAVEGNHHVEINSFEVRVNGKILGACVRFGEQPKGIDLSKMQAEGIFDENMHGTELEVTVQYTLKVSCCVRIKKSFVTRCAIEVTN